MNSKLKVFLLTGHSHLHILTPRRLWVELGSVREEESFLFPSSQVLLAGLRTELT